MSRLLWNDRGTPDRKKGRDTMGFTGSFAPVTTLFAVQSHLDRSSIHLFAQTHPEVRALAVVSTGREVLQLLQNGLNPQVIVLDMQLRDPGIQTLICGIRAMQLVPKPRLLLSAPTPEQTSGEDALLTFRGQEVILRPYEMRTLFERVYLLGAGDEAAQLYRVRNHCRRILRDMQANPVLSGCTYLERMILFAWSDERDLPIGILYQMAGGRACHHSSRWSALPCDAKAGHTAVSAALCALWPAAGRCTVQRQTAERHAGVYPGTGNILKKGA